MAGFTKGEQNAATLGDLFVIGDLSAGSVAYDTTDTTCTITHGLSATPDWIISQRSTEGDQFGVTANSTSITFTRTGTTAPGTIYAIYGNLS